MILQQTYGVVIDKTQNPDEAKRDAEVLTFAIQQVYAINVKIDVNTLTDFATIDIPKNSVQVKGDSLIFVDEYTMHGVNNSITYILTVGDGVIIELGYNSNNTTVFTGYIVSFDILEDRIRINVQDKMYFWKLKRNIAFSYKSVNLKQLLIDMGMNKHGWWRDEYIIDFSFYNIRTTGYLSVAEVLDMLKRQYSLFFYYKNGVLYAGTKYALVEKINEWNFSYPYKDSEDVFPVIKNNLKRTMLNNKVVSIVTVIQGDNSKNVFYMDTDMSEPKKLVGDIPDLYRDYMKLQVTYANISDEDAMTICKEQLKKTPSETYTGSFTTFGYPRIDVGDIIRMQIGTTRGDFESFSGIVEKIDINMDNKGFRQNIYLDKNWKK